MSEKSGQQLCSPLSNVFPCAFFQTDEEVLQWRMNWRKQFKQ